MLGKGFEMSLNFLPNPGPLGFGWAPNHFVLGAQLAPGEKNVSMYSWFILISIS